MTKCRAYVLSLVDQNTFRYKIAQSCWYTNPEERPTFEDLKTEISKLLEKNNEDYGYLQFNEEDGYEDFESIDQADEEKGKYEEQTETRRINDEKETLTTAL